MIEDLDNNKGNIRLIIDCKRAIATEKIPLPNIENEQAEFWKKHSVPPKTTPKKRVLTLNIWKFAASTAAILLIGLFIGAYLFQENPIQVFTADTTPQEIRLKVEGVTYTIDKQSADSSLYAQGIVTTPHAIKFNKSEHETKIKEQYQTLTIPCGQNYTAILSDGTTVSLNAASRLDFPDVFTGKQRTVYLHGEAYFDVTPDKEHPFIVKTDFFETTVLGTKFNICVYSEKDAHVTLIEGKVQVNDFKHEPLTLYPEEQATSVNGQLSQKKIDIYPILEWQKGYFYFDNVSLLHVMEELGRWYNVDIIFKKKEHMNYQMHFVANRNEPLYKALQNLNALGIVHAVFKDNQVSIR